MTFRHLRNYEDLYAYINERLIENSYNYIFIDEIQEIRDFHLTLRSLALDEHNDIYITSSNSEMFSGDLSNELGGRYVEFKIHGLSYNEFLLFHKLEDCDESLERFLHFGGLPYLIHLPLKDDVVSEYLRSIYSTILLRDVIQRRNIRNTVFLEQLIRFLADNTGSIFSSKKISDFLKNQKVNLAPNQVSEYADFLSEAYIIEKAERYNITGKKVFERGEKYYFEDLGIRYAVVGYTIADRGKRLENIVFNHLCFCGYNVKVGILPSGEIDFVCEKNGETLYVQATTELSRQETIEREFDNLLKIRDNYPKIVVSLEKSFENTYKGIKHIYLRDFLKSDF